MKNKTTKRILLALLLMAAIGAGIALFIFKQPHRDVQSTKTDYSLNASDIVNEYLADANLANEKYLDDEGESKVLEVVGTVKSTEEDYEGKTVVILQKANDKAGVACTLIQTPSAEIKPGSELNIKGVIRSGAAYDEDLEMFEPVIMEECEILK